jgi:hypothetical protein
VTDETGEPVMVGKGKRRGPKTRIVAEDAEGRVIDLHAMRTTLGTNLARAGPTDRAAHHAARRLPNDAAALHGAGADRHGEGNGGPAGDPNAPRGFCGGHRNPRRRSPAVPPAVPPAVRPAIRARSSAGWWPVR